MDPFEPGDYTLTPCGPLGSKIGVGVHEERFLGEFPDTDQALAAIREQMDIDRFWPTVWWVSDHGNPWPIDPRTGEEIKVHVCSECGQIEVEDEADSCNVCADEVIRELID